MTELEEARAYLRERQEVLSRCRRMSEPIYVRRRCETAVVAALSWVWDAQEHAGRKDAETIYQWGQFSAWLSRY